MKTLAKIRKCVYPHPVYEAHWSDGTVSRLSFWSEKGKPVTGERGRRLVQAPSRWTPTGITRFARYAMGNPYTGGAGNVSAPYTPITRGLLSGKRLVRGYVEHDSPGKPWVRFVDPHFMPHPVPESAKAKRQTARQVKTILADLVAYLDGNGPDDALKRARDLIAA